MAKEEEKKVAGAKPKAKGGARGKKDSPKEITVLLKRSGIGRPKDQKATIKGLGFKRVNQILTVRDTPETRGMIRKISHLVEVL